MKAGGWVPISKYLKESLPQDREYTELEAAYSLTLDYDNCAEVSVLGYSRLWRWSRTRVIRYLKEMGVELERIDPRSRKSLSRLKVSQQQNNGKTSKKQKRMIDSRCLSGKENIKKSEEEKQEGTSNDTGSSNPHKPTPGQVTCGDKAEGEDQSSDQEDYLRLLAKYEQVRSISSLADHKHKKWIEQGGMSARDYEQLANWRSKEKRALLSIVKKEEINAMDQKLKEIAVASFAGNLAALPEGTRCIIERLSDKKIVEIS